MDFRLICDQARKIGANLYDLAVYENGRIQSCRFQECSNCNDSYSVAKAYMVTAMGFLHDDGLIDEKQTLSHYMGDLIPRDADPAWRVATVENALTHTLGFGEGFLDIDTEDASEYPTDDYLDMVFHHPLAYRPGTGRKYTDAAYYLLSRLFSCVAKENVDTFLRRRLFEPMKVREVAWSCCPQGYPLGGTGLYISAHDMVKLPALYLERGVWNGRRILSEKWIDKVIEKGYEFSVKTERGLVWKKGMCCQMVMFSRENGFAVAWHGHDGRQDRIQALIECFDI